MVVVKRFVVLVLLSMAVDGLARARGFHPERCPFAKLATHLAEPPHTTRTEEYLLRTHDTADGPYHEVLVIRTYESAGDFRTKVIRREVRKGAPNVSPEEAARIAARGITDEKAEAIWYSLISPALEKNIAKYKDRRTWTAAFRRKLREIAREYLNDSTYVVVQRKTDDDVVGSIRFIQAPYGIVDGKLTTDADVVREKYGPIEGFREKNRRYHENGLPLPPLTLPELAYLGVEPERPEVDGEGQITELGALFVEETLTPGQRDQVWAEWLTALERIAHERPDSLFNYYGQSWHFNLDKVSQHIYKPWQYEAGPVVHKYGTSWMVSQWHLERIDDYFKRFTSREVPHHQAVESWKALSGRTQTGEWADPLNGFLLSGEPEVEIKSWTWAATEKKLPETVNSGALGMLIRYIDLFEMHTAVYRGETWDSPIKSRAESAMRAMWDGVNQAKAKLYEMRNGNEAEFRWQLARYTTHLLKISADHEFLSDGEVLRDFVAPALLDSHPWVRQNALWGFAELTPERVRRSLGDESKAWRVLEERGITREAAAPAVAALAAALRLPKPGADRASQDAYWQRLKPTLDALEPLRAHGPEIGPALLSLASLQTDRPPSR